MGGVFSLLGAFDAKDSRIIRYDTCDSCIKIRGEESGGKSCSVLCYVKEGLK